MYHSLNIQMQLDLFWGVLVCLTALSLHMVELCKRWAVCLQVRAHLCVWMTRRLYPQLPKQGRELELNARPGVWTPSRADPPDDALHFTFSSPGQRVAGVVCSGHIKFIDDFFFEQLTSVWNWVILFKSQGCFCIQNYLVFYSFKTTFRSILEFSSHFLLSLFMSTLLCCYYKCFFFHYIL